MLAHNGDALYTSLIPVGQSTFPFWASEPTSYFFSALFFWFTINTLSSALLRTWPGYIAGEPRVSV